MVSIYGDTGRGGIMTDYLALAREALTCEGISAYFGDVGTLAYGAGTATADDLARILARQLATNRVYVPTDGAWSCPSWLPSGCMVTLIRSLWAHDSSIRAVAAGLGVDTADIEALMWSDQSDSFGDFEAHGVLSVGGLVTLADAVVALSD